MTFTVFTPLYNRSIFLKKIYDSLLIQSFQDFEWLIVDDGSNDNPELVIEQFIFENKISINYYKKHNGGKHTAINYGVSHAQGSLFIILDSDDFFASNALELLHKEWVNIKDDHSICGIVGLSSYIDNTIVGSSFPDGLKKASFSDLYYKYHVTGDKTVAFKTSVMKEYPFPEEDGIRLVFEAVVWHDMSKKYKVRCVNQIIQFVEYQNEGLSNSSYKLWYLKSMAFSYFTLIQNKTHPFKKYPKTFVWNYIHLAINSKLIKENYFNKLKLQDKFIYLLVLPRAYFAYLRMKRKIN